MAQLTERLERERPALVDVRRAHPLLGWPLRAGTDLILICAGFWLAYLLRYELEVGGEIGPDDYRPFGAFMQVMALLASLLLAVFAARGLYRLSRWTGLLDEALLIGSSALISFGALIVIVFYGHLFWFSRLIFLYALAIIVALLIAERGLRGGMAAWMRSRGKWIARVLVVGAGPAGERVMSALSGQRRRGLDLVGFVDDSTLPPEWAIATQHVVVRPPRLGACADLPEVVRREGIDEVVIALPPTAHDQLYWAIEQCRSNRVPFTLLPDLFELSLDRVEIHSLNGLPLITVRDSGIHGWNFARKRAFDVAFGGLALAVATVPMLIIALLIRLDSPGPALYPQTRVGKDGRRFKCYKFRTMHQNAHSHRSRLLESSDYQGDRVAFKMKDDPRRTRVGRFLRSLSLDELPNLFNVIRGEMSIVGPRPHIPEEVARYEPWHLQRLAITPGLTCLWQVNGRSDLTFDEQVRFDLYYAERWSLWLDIKIILRTIPAVLTGRGAY